MDFCWKSRNTERYRYLAKSKFYQGRWVIKRNFHDAAVVLQSFAYNLLIVLSRSGRYDANICANLEFISWHFDKITSIVLGLHPARKRTTYGSWVIDFSSWKYVTRARSTLVMFPIKLMKFCWFRNEFRLRLSATMILDCFEVDWEKIEFSYSPLWVGW